MLSGKVACITGGASGIGAATARLFVKEGARVVLGDTNIEKSQQLAEELGGEIVALAVQCDVRQEGEVEAFVKAATDAFGRLDIMVANAGYAGRQNTAGSLMENLYLEEFTRQIEVNLRGVALCIKHAGLAMKRNQPATESVCGVERPAPRGVILATSSVAGLLANCATSGDPMYISAGYGASKAGVITLVKLGACELAPYQIRVAGVAPGYVATPMVGAVLMGDPEKPTAEVAAALAATSCAKGVPIVPQDIANAFLFLASDAARCVTGHTLVVDNGMVAGVAGYVPCVQVDEA
ncbi:short-chain dehydrogenase reductase [Micractinium conductrix]|uniref:Short-chain dehydrogenase reductase n=1 Tax=Micractinium conductrix TaxID=554055 RepID=A0A2P6VJV1_9CHLO|nr:short-chain dehydrogenase reductase [Micractinium conductrix]|eukprot:PSC74354.1 short-chain dehydrogenase reductase [Micractinium conductrix]